jgi:sulfur carrier protein
MPNRTNPQSIQVNGQTEALTCATLSALLDAKEIAGAPRGVAIALNGVVVPRAAWPNTPLAAGDQVEIVRVKQGG